MASKLFAPFKKLPQQLPLFKKSKFKNVFMSNYNTIYGMMDNVTCVAFDNDLYLLALCTKKGEIKIFGSSGLMYSVVDIKNSICFIKFLNNQGRLLAVGSQNETIIFDYKPDISMWLTSSVLYPDISPIPQKVVSVDVSQSLSWKSESDEFLQLTIHGYENNLIRCFLTIGPSVNFCENGNLIIEPKYFLKCPDLDKDFDFGKIDLIKFNPTDSSKFFVLFKNGLVMIFEAKICKGVPENVTKDNPSEVAKESKDDVKAEENKDEVKTDSEGVKEAENATSESAEDKVSEPQTAVEAEKETEEKETENLEKTDEDNNKSEKEKELEEIRKNEEVQKENDKFMGNVEFLEAEYYVQKPTVINYILTYKKINSACWIDDKVCVILEDSQNVDLYEISGDGSNLNENVESSSLPEQFPSSISKFTYFDLKSERHAAFVTHENDKQNLLYLMKDDKIYAEFETPSRITDYVIVKCPISDDDTAQIESRALLIFCESQMIAIDLASDELKELQAPFLHLQNTCPITALTSVIQVPVTLFGNCQTVSEIFKDWPIKTPLLTNDKIEEDTLMDIMATGHSDGSICLWQVMQSGIFYMLAKVESPDIFKQTSEESELSDHPTSRKKVGHRLIEVEESLLQITNIQLLLHCTNNFDETSSNELFCLAGTSNGTVLIFKFDGLDSNHDIIEISAELDSEGINWIDSAETPELLDKSDISQKSPKLKYIVKLIPSLPITSMSFQPTWDLLAVGSSYGFVLIDFRQSKCIFSHLTISRPGKINAAPQPPLTMGQQLKKSIRQSFRKLKKLKPAVKHTYTVNEEKSKDKEEQKATEKKEEKDATKPEEGNESVKEVQQVTDVETTEDKPKEEIKDQTEETDVAIITNEPVAAETFETELINIEILRKDRPISTVGSLLLVCTNLTSSNKIPCLFAATNIGSIFAFEISFEDETDNIVLVKLCKELHMQHKAPILLMGITNSSHVPLISSTDQVGSFQRKVKNADELKVEDEKQDINTDSKELETTISPSSDSEAKDDTNLKSGTLPTSVVHEEGTEIPPEGPRRSVDSTKDKIPVSNASMKKSGTLPASFLQAIGKTQGSGDSHELLVVSEEQVKLFNLPSLKAKYKYKVVDTGHHYTHSKTSNNQETEQQQTTQEKNVETGNAETINEASKPVSRRIASVGLCKMLGSKTSGNKWEVAIGLTNGEIIGLQINNLKKYFSDIFNNSTSSILSSISNGELNLGVSYTHKWNIQITDFSQTNSLRYEPLMSIVLPLSARPIKDKQETDVKVVSSETAEEDKANETEAAVVVNGHHHGATDNQEEDEEKDQMGDEAILQNTSAVHHGDITMDSIKEYITNIDGNITIKTFESTKEKQITVDGGHIVTTIHEKQIKDGEIIKDDVVKITSDARVSNE